MHIPVLDGHNGLVWQLRTRWGHDPARFDLAAGVPDVHTDLPRLRAGGVTGQFWSVFVPGKRAPGMRTTGSFFADTCEQIDAVYALAARYPEDFLMAVDAAGAEVSGPIASLIGAEGGHCIENSLDRLRELFDRGVRYLTLTHNENNEWADSATDSPEHFGLSDFGREVVAEMNRLGMIVDLSHTSADTMRDALALSKAPVIFSHSSARAVTDHVRNVPDDVLVSMAAGGGVCMVTFVEQFVSDAVNEWLTGFISAAAEAGIENDWDPGASEFFASYSVPKPRASIGDLVQHVEHVREVAGVDHVGLGGDFDGTSWSPRASTMSAPIPGCSRHWLTRAGAGTSW